MMNAYKNHTPICSENKLKMGLQPPRSWWAIAASHGYILAPMVALVCLLGISRFCAAAGADWPAVGGDRGGSRFSTLDQINRSNVNQLQVAWTYDTGDSERGLEKTNECTPLVVDGTMYVTTASGRVVALDAAKGHVLWEFIPPEWPYRVASGGVNRGVAYWQEGAMRRILHGMADGRLWSLDAATGRPDQEFGTDGFVDLRAGIKPDISELTYGMTSAPAIYEDTIIAGFSCGEGPGPVAPGDIRAFNVRTGEEKWRFHTVPRPGEFGNETWAGDSWKNRGAANAWGGINVDTQRGLVFAGIGSAAFDFYGGDRKGQNLFANSVVCLDANTGERKWHFQTLHHDLWDHDLPTPPICITIDRNGTPHEAVAQVTKTGYVFLFDRTSGEPLFEIQEIPVPTDGVEGEYPWPTQPHPVKPPAIARTTFTEEDVTDISPEARAHVLERLQKLRAGTAFEPPSLQGTVVVPGFHGGATWSGASFDPNTNLLYVNSNNIPNVITLEATSDKPYPYNHKGYHRFYDQDGYPAIKPPWGLLTAVDVERGEFAWQVPLGKYPELRERGVPQTGTENFGGTIATAGGLVFIGGSKDEMFHAFNSATGELLWQTQLPAGGYATPSTYAVGGTQYVVIAAAGAGKLRTKADDKFIVFSLPVGSER